MTIPERPRLVNVGRLSEQKGQFDPNRGGGEITGGRGIDFELVIVGDGPMRGEIESMIDRFGLQERVRITGFLSNQGVYDELLAAGGRFYPALLKGYRWRSWKHWPWADP